MGKHFKYLEIKTGEMKTLIGQSESVLQEMRSIFDGAIRSMKLLFGQHDVAFTQIYAKHKRYDDIVSRPSSATKQRIVFGTVRLAGN